MTCATAYEHREGNRLIAADRRLVFGTAESLEAALAGKDWQVHGAKTYLTISGYDFRRAVRPLRVKAGEGRSPAMAASLSDHVRTWLE